MNNKVLNKQFIRIVIPIAVQNLLTSLVSASDALMLGGLNQSSLSAVSLATQITFVISLFYMALTFPVFFVPEEILNLDSYATQLRCG